MRYFFLETWYRLSMTVAAFYNRTIRAAWRRFTAPWAIARCYENREKWLAGQIDHLEKRVAQLITVHADLHMKERPHATVIVCGRFKNRDYVRVFNVEHSSLPELIERLRWEEKHARVGYIDSAVPFRAVYQRKRFD